MAGESPRPLDLPRSDGRVGRPLELRSAAPTFGELVDDWWISYVTATLSPHTQQHYADVLRLYLLPYLADTRVSEITPRVVTALRSELARREVGAARARRTLAVLQSILSLAVEQELVADNPVAKIRKPPYVPARSVRPIAPAAVEALRARMGHADATLISVLAYAGLRPGEALALRWNDIGERVLNVERAAAMGQIRTTKTGRSRTVRLLAPLADDLRRWRSAVTPGGSSALVFGRSEGALWRDQDWRGWRKSVFRPAARAVGLDGARPYDLRASFVSLLIFEGHTVVEVAAQAGHSAQTCLRHYARVFAEYDPDARVPAEEQIRAARAGHSGDDLREPEPINPFDI